MLADAARRAGDLQKRLNTNENDLELDKEELETKELVLKEQCRDEGTLQIDLKAARAEIGRDERVIHNFANRACTGYTIVIRAQASSYRDGFDDVLGDSQSSGEYPGGFHVRVVEDEPSLHHGDEDSDEECGGRTPPTEGDHLRDEVVVVSPSAGFS